MNEIPATLLQHTPFFARLLVPKSTEEFRELAQLRSIVREMELVEADLHPSEDKTLPIVRLRYTAADMPQIWWSKYLWAQVRTENNYGWLVRLGMIAQARHELYFRALPDKLELAVAQWAIRSNDPRIIEIRLGVLWPRQNVRHLIF